MSELTTPPTADLTREAQAANDFKNREAWFTSTPDPWVEIARLEYGADRTYASTVHRMIVNAETAQHPTMEAKLRVALARPEITEAGRQFVCRMLGLVGTEACIPDVAALLGDSATADVARSALDFIPDRAVDAAYRAALGKMRGSAKIGLMGSMAWRGDVESIAALTAVALDESEAMEVRTAAERAVEKIAAGGQK